MNWLSSMRFGEHREVMSVPALVFAALFDFHKIADVVSTGALCTFSLVCASLILLRLPRKLNATGANSEEEPVKPSAPSTETPRLVIAGLRQPAALSFQLIEWVRPG